MYDLVVDVPEYPKFLPWCAKAEVLETTPDGMTAKLGLSFAGVRQSFTTKNTHVPGERMLMSLVDGPFSQLEGDWRFLPLGTGAPSASGADAAVTASACKIDFSLRYAFSSLPLELVVSPVFDRIANTLVDSFVKRAEQVYGSR
ncbi:type II toxin-antitoxin system RatA family toxin [soil metagenome]